MSGIARIRPSRRFLIAQSVLNAAKDQSLDPQWAIRFYTDNGTHLPGWLEAAVCREFRALSERWAA